MKALILVSLIAFSTALPALADLTVFQCDKDGTVGLKISSHETIGAPYGQRRYAYTMEITNPALLKKLEAAKAIPPSAVKGEVASLSQVSPTNTGFGVNMGAYGGAKDPTNLILGVSNNGVVEVDEYRLSDDDPIPTTETKAAFPFDHCSAVVQ
jgi:hypothetical protein